MYRLGEYPRFATAPAHVICSTNEHISSSFHYLFFLPPYTRFIAFSKLQQTHVSYPADLFSISPSASPSSAHGLPYFCYSIENVLKIFKVVLAVPLSFVV